MDSVLWNYLTDEYEVRRNAFTLTTSWQQFIGANPQRFVYQLAANTTQTISVGLSYTNPPPFFYQSVGPVTFQTVTWNTFGGFVHSPLWGLAGGGAPTLTVTELLMTPKKYEEFKRYCRHVLSNAGAL